MKTTNFKSRAQEALAYMTANPQETPYAVANKFEVSRSYLYARKQTHHTECFICLNCGAKAKTVGRRPNPNSKTQRALLWLDSNPGQTASEAARIFNLKGPGSVVHASAMRNLKKEFCTKCRNILKAG